MATAVRAKQRLRSLAHTPSLIVCKHKTKLNCAVVAILLTAFSAVALTRIVATYWGNSQAFDEHCHIAAGMEFLDRHTYLLDPVHPPLSRIAIALPLYLAGERYPATGAAATSHEYNLVGNAILQDSGHYVRNLALARLGVLPFLLLAIATVFVWTREQFGDAAALSAVGLLTTLPIVLAFSSIAYTDIVAASTQITAFFAFARWLEQRTMRSSAMLGGALALALLSKATTLMFFPAGAVAMLIAKAFLDKKAAKVRETAPVLRQVAVVVLIVCALVWAGYGFSVEHIREATGLSLQSLPSFQHFPSPLRSLARQVVVSDPLLPAPELIKGLATAWVLNRTVPAAYLLGNIKAGGWWYFFLVGIAVKCPLPFLILVMIGGVSLLATIKSQRWTAIAPAVCVIAVLMVTMPVKYNAGMRHVLVVFPLMAIIAAVGCSYLWRGAGKWHVLAKTALCLLIGWQVLSTVQAQHDFIAYFNELAGKDPSKVLVNGCDLDCGQDVFRLASSLRERHISHLHLAIWSSADMARMGLPQFDVPGPYAPVTGWFAISMRALRFGDLFHQSYPPDAFDWLKGHRPVGKIGSTILLYYLPDSGEEKLRLRGAAAHL